MRHKRAFRKFSRTPAHRRAMFRNMATSLFLHEKLETTLHKAKDLRGVSEKLITLAGEDTLHRRRQAYSYLKRKEVVHKLFSEIGPRYRTRPGGYTRVIRTGIRAGDTAQMAVIELVSEDYKPKKKKSSDRSKKKTESKKNADTKKAESKKRKAKAEPKAEKEEKVEAAAEEVPAEPAEE